MESVVYFTKDITPESLAKIYEALGANAHGNVAVKISTGEMGGNNYLKPDLIKGLVDYVKGTIVECNTAYEGQRNTTAKHLKTIQKHGFTKIADVDILDSEGEFQLPVKDTTYIKYNIVGNHLKDYDFLINLAHFKGHEMGGFGGVLKNQSIGLASPTGKTYIHSTGKTQNPKELMNTFAEQEAFLESMAAAAQSVHDYFGENIVYINIMNNMSIDCDCSDHPADPEMKDMGIAASLDPVALDKACVDMVFNHKSTDDDNSKPLIDRIKEKHGIHTIEHAEKLGLGTTNYKIVEI